MARLMTRDSALWWVVLFASVLTYLSGHFELLGEAFPGLSPAWESRIELLAGLSAMVAAYLRLSPLKLSTGSELAGVGADPTQSLTMAGNKKPTDVIVFVLAAVLSATTVFAQTPTELIDHALADLAEAKRQLAAPGMVIAVPAGGDLQAALDTAKPGQTIQLAPATFAGNYILRKKPTAAGVITIRTEGLDDTAIPPGVRVTPALSPRMAKLGPKDATLPTLTAEFGADGYTLIGVEFLGNAVLPDRSLILFGYNATTLDDLPRNIVFDRVYAHGDPEKGGHNGCSCHGINITFINGYWSGFWERGRDSQAIGAYNGAGPYHLENNYLEGSGENVMFGGADPAIPNLITSDIVIRRNHFFKPLEWKTKTGSVKNLLEFKNAQRVLVEGNVFENVWADAQAGNAILFTVRNQNGGCPWCVVQDVVFQYNVLKNVQTFGFNILGLDDIQTTTTKSGRITIRHNVIEAGRAAIVQHEVDGLTFDHNLMIGINNSTMAIGSGPHSHVVVTNNITQSGPYGVTGEGTAPGAPAFNWCCPGYVFTNNVVERTAERFINWPAGNYLLAPMTLAGRLDAAFAFTADAAHITTDGQPIGPDFDRLRALVQGVAAFPFADIKP